MLGLAACATRPGPQTLDPVAGHANAAGSTVVYAVTDRAPVGSSPAVLGDGRGTLAYEQFTMQAVGPAAAGGQAGKALLSRENDPSKDFVTVGRQKLDQRSFLARINRAQEAKDGTTVVFVHGYNYSYQEAVFRLAQLSVDAGSPAVPILFSWPSQADFRGYVADRDSSTYARDDLVHLLTLLSRSHSRERIAVIGHSMGGWLVMEALRQLRLQGRDDVIARLQVALASPDIDVDVFRAQTAVIGQLSPPILVLASKDDRALAISSRLTGGRPRLGLVSIDDPRVQEVARQSGVQIMDISALPASDGFNHNRFITFAARYSAPEDGRSMGVVRQAGVYLLDTTGRILSAPFSQTAQLVGGSR